MSQIYSRIEKALRDSISYHNDGMSANEAVIKSASLHELNPETICRVVEAFNTAKTRAFVKKAKVKDSYFETANKEDVIKGVFSGEKKAQSVRPVSSFSFSLKKKDEVDIFAKEAQEVEFDVNEKIKEASKSLEYEIKDLAEKKQYISDARLSFEQGLSKVAEFFSYRHNQEAADSLFDKAAFQYAENENTQKLIELICKIAGLEYEYPQQVVPSTYGDGSDFYEIFDGLIDDIEECNGRSKEYNKAARELYDMKTELDKILDNYVAKTAGIKKDDGAVSFLLGGKSEEDQKPFEKLSEDILSEFFSAIEPKSNVEAKEPTKNASDFLKKSSEQVSIPPLSFFNIGKLPVGDFPESPNIKDYVDKGYRLRAMQERGITPESVVESEMNNVRREAMLRDFLQNDEIISTYDPETIVGVYNSMVQLAPNASLIPDVARSVLRYSTGQAIDPHYAAQLVELENAINKRDGKFKDK